MLYESLQDREANKKKMSDHKVTEEITQAAGRITVKIYCSCGIVVEEDTRKTSLRALRASMPKLHEIAEEAPKPKKQKKAKKEQPVVETEPENDTEPELPIDEDWPDEGRNQS